MNKLTSREKERAQPRAEKSQEEINDRWMTTDERGHEWGRDPGVRSSIETKSGNKMFSAGSD